MNFEPIFICGSHKSGTSLLRSLFDGHSQLYAIPIETHYFQNIGYWIDNEYRFQRPMSLNREQIIEQFCRCIHHNNQVESRYSDSICRGIFNEENFRSNFSKINFPEKDDALLTKYFESIYYSIEDRMPEKNIRFVEKSVENAEFAEELVHIFPKVKFIHIIRNPYANVVALRKFKSIKFGYPIMRRIIRTLYNNFYFLYRNRRTIKNYFVIRYEDLLFESKKYLKQMCEFLNINFEDILLTPTHRRKLWQGNSMTDRLFRSIDSSNIDYWKKNIHPMEVEYINRLFPFVLNDFGYEKFTKHGLFWKPAPGENLPRYLANRFYRFYLQEWKVNS